MILPADSFAENLEHLNHKVEYLRLLGLDAYYVADTNMVVIGGLVCSDTL